MIPGGVSFVGMNDDETDRVSLAGVDPVEALRALLKVDPDSEVAEPTDEAKSSAASTPSKPSPDA